jgi:hypothetical protein
MPSFLSPTRGPDREFSTTRLDFDRKKGNKGNISMLFRENSVCVGATPPGSIEEEGMESMTQCILLGPLLAIFRW